MSYKFPGPAPRQRQHHPLPPVQKYYPLSIAGGVGQAPLAQPSNGTELRTILLILAAAAFGLWLYNRFFAKKKSVGNEPMFFTTAGPLRGLDRVAKRIRTHAQLLRTDGYDGVAKDIEEASDLIESFTGRTREQTLDK